MNVPICGGCGSYIEYVYGVRSCQRCGPVCPDDLPLSLFEEWADEYGGLSFEVLDEDVGLARPVVERALSELVLLHGWQEVINFDGGLIIYPPSWAVI